MKLSIFLLALILFSACTDAKKTKKREAANPSCLKFRNGEFELYDLETGELITRIWRNGALQYETSDGLELEEHVSWINDCSYQVRVTGILKNPEHSSIPKGSALICTIGEISGDTCEIATAQIGVNQIFKFKMIKRH